MVGIASAEWWASVVQSESIPLGRVCWSFSLSGINPNCFDVQVMSLLAYMFKPFLSNDATADALSCLRHNRRVTRSGDGGEKRTSLTPGQHVTQRDPIW
jgi:hypothetical protein